MSGACLINPTVPLLPVTPQIINQQCPTSLKDVNLILKTHIITFINVGIILSQKRKINVNQVYFAF